MSPTFIVPLDLVDSTFITKHRSQYRWSGTNASGSRIERHFGRKGEFGPSLNGESENLVRSIGSTSLESPKPSAATLTRVRHRPLVESQHLWGAWRRMSSLKPYWYEPFLLVKLAQIKETVTNVIVSNFKGGRHGALQASLLGVAHLQQDASSGSHQRANHHSNIA